MTNKPTPEGERPQDKSPASQLRYWNDHGPETDRTSQPARSDMVEAERDVTVINYGNPVDKSAGRAPSGEAIDWRAKCEALLDIWDDAQGNPPESLCYVEGAWLDMLNEIRAALARRATAGTTAAPSDDDDAFISSAVRAAKVLCVHPDADTTRDIGRAVLAAWRAAPTDAVAEKWAIYYDNLGSEPYESQFMQAWQLYDSEGEAARVIEKYPRSKAHYRPVRVWIYASPDLATSAAAPGDLPKLPEPECAYEDGKNEWGYTDYSHAFTADQMREYGRACIASNAGAAPGLDKLGLMGYCHTMSVGKFINDGREANVWVYPRSAYPDGPKEGDWMHPVYVGKPFPAAPSDTSPVGATQEKE
jgi:hypothetical protein